MARATLLILLATVAAVASAGHSENATDMRLSDGTLINYIKNTDPVFQRVLGTCHSEKLVRTQTAADHLFTYTAQCDEAPADEDDCYGYAVKADGTVDSASVATVRNLSLALQCSS